jgi:sigma-B regulation protein RsbU (phosphoserine phosphatase)
MGAVAELLITLADGRTIRQPLTGNALVAGRDPTCDLFIDDPSTSRKHARFSRSSDGYLVEDLGSKNGTYVNDAPCQMHILRNGDHVLLGSVLVVFSENGGSEPPSVVIEEDAPTTHATRYVTSNKRLLLSQRRLEMIYDLSERLTTLQSQDRLLDDAMNICFETLQFERGAIGVRRTNQRALDWPVVRNLRGAGGELTISRTLLNRALEHGERATFTAGGLTNADPTVSIVQHGIRSALCVPLIHRDQILGVIYGDRTSSAAAYSNEDVDFLAGIAQQISIGLINTRLMEEQRQTARLHHDLDIARKIQTGLFPRELPNRDGLRMAALNEPGQRISGDYYDVIETSDGRVWCLVADVSGEGISAALVMANFQAAVRVTIDETDDPGELMTRWNRLLCSNTDPSKFITALCSLIDPRNHVIRFASAGHLPPLLIRMTSGSVEPLDREEHDFPLGISADAAYSTTELSVGPEPFVLYGYTDGIIEAMDAEGNQFGLDRLVMSLAEHRGLTMPALVKQVRKAVTQFVGPAAQSDDITMLAVHVG